MCTLTWWHGDRGQFEVFFNRDELKTRPEAEAPRVRERNGVRFLSPRDPVADGTWMLANEYGVVLCLLNRWHEQAEADREWQSRGRLVWDLADVKARDEIEERLRGRELADTRPFSLWACDPGGAAGWDWTTGELRPARDTMPVTSSSFRFEEVAAARRERFERLDGSTRSALRAFHAGPEESSAFTVRMCRPDAQTMSRSEVRVGPREIRWRYLAERPELSGAPSEHQSSLARH